MRFHGIDMQGKFYVERIKLTDDPWGSADEGRIVYDTDNDYLYFADGTEWIRLCDNTDLTTHTALVVSDDVHGLGSIASQESNAINITGGTITGITDLAIADGGTGASTAENARTNLGLTGNSNTTHYHDTRYLRLGASTTSVGDTLYDIGSSTADRFANIWSEYFRGEAITAQYADMAEKHTCDPEVPFGTIVEISRNKKYEVEPCDNPLRVFGIISKTPAFRMNEGIEGLYVGLSGRLPVRIIGKVLKGDPIRLYRYGVGMSTFDGDPTLFGYSLEENLNEPEKLVEVSLKR